LYVMFVVKDTGKEEYLRPFIHIGLDWIVCPSCPRRAAALGYRHGGGCLQLSHVRTADPSATDADPP